MFKLNVLFNLDSLTWPEHVTLSFVTFAAVHLAELDTFIDVTNQRIVLHQNDDQIQYGLNSYSDHIRHT
jgi:hypothetical protein